MVRVKTENEYLEEAGRRLRDLQADIQTVEISANAIKIDYQLLEQEVMVTRLSKEEGQYADSVTSLNKERSELSGCQKSIEEGLEKLGRDWSEEKVMQVDMSLFTRQAIRDFEIEVTHILDQMKTLGQQISDLQDTHDRDLERVKRGREDLEKLGTPDPAPDPTILRGLQTGRDQFASLAQDLPGLDTQLASETAAFNDFVAGIDQQWTAEDVERFDTSVNSQRTIEEIDRRVIEVERAKYRIEQDLRGERRSFEDYMEERQEAQNDLDKLPVPEFSSHDEGVKKKELIRNLQRSGKVYHEREAVFATKTVHYNSLAERRKAVQPGSLFWIRSSLLLSLLFGAGAISIMVWLAYVAGWVPFLLPMGQKPSWWALGLLASGASFLLFLILLSAYLNAQKQRKRSEEIYTAMGTEIQSVKGSLDELEAAREEVKQKIATLTKELGIERPEDEGSVESLEDHVQEELLVLRDRDRISRLIRKLDDEILRRKVSLDHLNGKLDNCEEDLKRSREAWEQFARQLGFSAEIDPSIAKVIFEKIDATKRDLQRIKDLERRKYLMEQENIRYMNLGKNVPALSGFVNSDPTIFLGVVDRCFERERSQEQLRRTIKTDTLRLEEQGADLADLEGQIERKRKDLEHLESEKEKFEIETWGPWLSTQGLPHHLSPQTAIDALFAVEKCKMAIVQKQAYCSKITSLETSTKEYVLKVSEVAEKIGSPLPEVGQIELFVDSSTRNLKEALGNYSDMRALRKQIAILQRAAEKETRNIDEIRKKLAQLYETGGAADLDEFVRRGDTFQKQESLLQRIRQHEESLKKISGEPDLNRLKERLKLLTIEEVKSKLRELDLVEGEI
ncbi:MAG: hypothetical protein GY852_03050, partial [bacterium]|nr:hypothetical protein [bacterium]